MTFNENFRRPVVRRVVVGLTAAALVVSSCGGSDDDGAASDDTTAVSDSGSVDGDPVGSDGEAQSIEQNRPVEVEGAALLPFPQDEVEDSAVGETAPVVSGQGFDGTPITVGGPSDNPTLVVFLAHWCPHCNDEVPALIELEDSGGIPEGLDVVGVSTAVDSSAPNYPPSEWAESKGWPWPMMADDAENSAIIAMGGTAFPFAVVLDTDGTVLARRAGEAPAAETKAFLDEVLADQDSA